MHSFWEASKRSVIVSSVLLPDISKVDSAQSLGSYGGPHRKSEMPCQSCP